MKTIFLELSFLAFYFFSNSLFSQNHFQSSDSFPSSVYKTKEDFIVNKISYSSPLPIKYTRAVIGSNIRRYSVYGDASIFLKLSDGNKMRIVPDSIFAFSTNGIKYIYSPSDEKYLAVLNDKPPIYLAVKVSVYVGYRYYSSSTKLLYTVNLNSPLKEFTDSNIQSDFGSNKELSQSLYKLHKFLDKGSTNLSDYSRRRFLQYQQVIQKILYN